jgi:predicted ATPase
MSPVFDPIIRLALALNSSRGAYAVLLGSGISAAAGVPTGRQIVADLISKVAALEGVSVGEDPIVWYRERFGEEPDYSKLLDELASSPTERSELLKRYFEPTEDQRRSGLRVPSAAHRALAQLAARGYISVFLTTNFDRLLEQALEAAGVAPTVLSTPDSLEGTVPLGRTRCTVVKLNGDYLDTRIKNTPDELDAYHPSIDRLLDRILDEYGLIVCGWSADWDTALRRALERSPTRRYTTFWASRNPPAGLAAGIVELRRAEVIRIKDADTLFTELAAKLSALDKSAGAATLEPGAPSSQTAASLPARAAAFVGRKVELREVEDRLQDSSARLLTLVGPGGTGKTTLAIQAAANVSSDFPDGVVFVELSSARTTDDVLVAITRTIGLGEVVERPLKDVLLDYLRPRHMLLVLDNFEQVIEAAGLLAQLLVDCPKLSILVTSREALHLRGEHLYPVPPLTLPSADPRQVSARQLERCEAAQLFVDRAQAVRPDFRLTDDNAPAVAQICRRLDGLPLAIELAAARLRLFSPEALQDQLQDRLKLLRSGPRDLPERQQTLRATMDWSYDLLKPDEQRLFELLAVFAGADIAAVEAVTAQIDPVDGVVPDVLDSLASLIEKSLIRQMELPHSGPRIAMLETIREFATDRLGQRPDLAARARQAHASYYADLVHRLQPDLTGSRRLEALSALVAEIENLRIAWDYWVAAEDLAQLEKLADGLLTLNESRGWYLATVGLTTDMLAVLAGNAFSPDRINQEIALRTSLARALLATRGFTPEVEDAFARSIELFERGGTDTHQHFSALRGLANLYSLRGDLQNATRIGLELLEFAERENNPTMLIEGHLLMGASNMFIYDLQAALDHLDRAISLFAAVPPHAFTSRAGGNDPRVACYTTSAFALWLLGYPDRAVERANAALAQAAEVGHPFTLAYARFHSALLHLWRRDFDTVLDRVGGLLEIADEHGFQIWKAAGTVLSGAAQVGVGRFEEGLATLRGGMDIYQGLRSPPVFWPMLLSIQATACHRAGRPAEGLPPIEAAIEIMSPGAGTTLLSEFQLLKGDLLLALATEEGREDSEAEHWYRLAIERARAQNVRISELRAATRLCRVAKPGDPHNAARRALAEVYATFTEGSTTRDLTEARELLDAMVSAS